MLLMVCFGSVEMVLNLSHNEYCTVIYDAKKKESIRTIIEMKLAQIELKMNCDGKIHFWKIELKMNCDSFWKIELKMNCDGKIHF